MKVMFWMCAAFIAYAYAGYPFLLWIISRYRTRPVLRKKITPTVSIIIAACNEQETLPAKLENLSQLNYPRDRVQIIVVSDGSTDGTAGILSAESEIVEPVILEKPCGKAVALNEAVRRAKGEIVVFMDARQLVDEDALSELVANFWDPEVGGVSGELILYRDLGSSNGLGTYWNVEKLVRKLESASGSVVGTTGALYAIRRVLFNQIPPGTILDDVLIPMNIVRQGKRVVFQSSAIVCDRVFTDRGKEFARKVRTMMGNYQLLWLAAWLITPMNPVLLRYVSHKLLRLLCPVLLVAVLIASGLSSGPFFRVVFSAQVFLYGLAAFGAVFPLARRSKVVAIPNAFVMLNAAAALALYNFVTGKAVMWRQGVNLKESMGKAS
jgi:cellulose synthase/poly-beta-1,6-N-acetylglucosamine synthase-like glycosyltransferase